MSRVGAIVLPQVAPERLPAAARVAEDAGLDELWLWEDSFLHGGVSAAATALATTSRLSVGIGVLPVPFRNVALAAMEIATLRRMFGDRAIVGVGHGVQEWMRQVGAKPESPLTLLREYLDALHALLRGDEVTVSGRYVHLDRVKLDWPPREPAPILAGAEGPKTLALAAEIADGIILVGGTPPNRVREVRALLGPQGRLVVFVECAFGPDGADRLTTAGRTDRVDAVAGSPVGVAAGIRSWVEAGADSVVLNPLAGDLDAEAFLRAAGEVAQRTS